VKLLYLAAGLLLATGAFASEAKTSYPAIYEGGSLPLNHQKVKATVEHGQLVFEQRGQRVVVSADQITAINCGVDVRRRFGAMFLDVVPKMRLGTAESDYIGVTWTTSGERPSQVEVLFKLSSREYREFLAALENSTGRKAVDPSKVPTVVRYD